MSKIADHWPVFKSRRHRFSQQTSAIQTNNSSESGPGVISPPAFVCVRDRELHLAPIRWPRFAVELRWDLDRHWLGRHGPRRTV